MLLEFKFKNFRSFKEENSINMTASSIKEHSYNIIKLGEEENLLKIGAIYGANASGKTNVIQAFKFMRYFVVASLEKEDESKKDYIIKNKFLFDEDNKNREALFEVYFIFDKKEYCYGFKLGNESVLEEWLYSKKIGSKSKTTTLFQRKHKQVVCKGVMKKAEKFKDGLSQYTLFLSLTSRMEINISKTIRDWFLKNNEMLDFGNTLSEIVQSIKQTDEKLEEQNYREKCESFLKAIDTGIDGIRCEKGKDENDKPIYKVYAKHKIIGTDKYGEILFTQESSGTQKMLNLFHFLMEVLQAGKILWIDELDAKLHPLLVRYIIKMFHSGEENKKNAQLIYTTHDVVNLTKDIFRRDEIWFVEKNTEGISELFSLVEYKLGDVKVRNDASYNKDYLSGRYGAIPILKEFNVLGDE